MSGEAKVLDKMPERIPINGTFELTIRCNLHCKMCLFRHDDSENAEIMANELTAEQWIDLGRQVAEAGTLNLLITGGEPLLRPDFCEIWEGLYKIGFIMTLYTNATLVTDKVMECLKKYPPHKIGVTIYGASPTTYERVTGASDAFEKAMEGTKKLISLPSQLTFRTTVIKDNLTDLEDLDSLLRERFDPDPDFSISQNVFRAVRGGCTDVDTCRIEPEKEFAVTVARTVHLLKRQVGDRFERGHVDFDWDDRSTSEELKKEGSHYSLFGCHAGMKSYTVSWDGSLLGCQLLGAFSQKIRNDFMSAWNKFPADVKIPPINDECRHCDLQNKCMICPAVLFSETGTLNKKPDYICSYTHSRENFIKKIKAGEVHYEDLSKAGFEL